MTDFPPKSPAVSGGAALGQATTYIDPNDPTAGYQGKFKHVYYDHGTENTTTYYSGAELRRIHSNSITFNAGYTRMDLTVPANDNTLSTVTVAVKDISIPSSVYLNGVLRSITWIGRTYALSFKANPVAPPNTGISTTGASATASYCGPTPGINQTNCWKIYTLRVYHGNITQNVNDIIIFGTMEGETSVTLGINPYTP